MGEQTKIEWTDHTFNPWWGCAKVSPGCDHCYAEAFAKRTGNQVWGVEAPRREFGDKHWNEPLKWDRAAKAAGKRARVFCASMADVFENHPDVNVARSRLWSLIEETPNLDWQLLTKRIGNVARMVPSSWLTLGWPDHVWLGASIVNQPEADRDISKLLAIPARVRFLSCEPLLGEMDVRPYLPDPEAIGASTYNDGTRRRCDLTGKAVDGIDWVISGGESGPKARPSHPEWHRSLRDQCAAAGVPFLFKQHGQWADLGPMKARVCAVDRQGRTAEGVIRSNFPKDASSGDGWQTMYFVGKKAAGRMLDGRTHDGFPTAATASQQTKEG